MANRNIRSGINQFVLCIHVHIIFKKGYIRPSVQSEIIVRFISRDGISSVEHISPAGSCTGKFYK